MNDAKKLEICIDALEKIRGFGRVCNDFELCNHDSCSDSAASSIIAGDTLSKIGRIEIAEYPWLKRALFWIVCALTFPWSLLLYIVARFVTGRPS